MTLVNFSRSSFIDSVEDGSKNFTIRAKRKFPFKKGDKLQLYTGLRTKHDKKLRDAICKNVWHLVIDKKEDDTYTFELDGEIISPKRVKEISKEVGFRSVDEWL